MFRNLSKLQRVLLFTTFVLIIIAVVAAIWSSSGSNSTAKTSDNDAAVAQTFFAAGTIKGTDSGLSRVDARIYSAENQAKSTMGASASFYVAKTTVLLDQNGRAIELSNIKSGQNVMMTGFKQGDNFVLASLQLTDINLAGVKQ